MPAVLAELPGAPVSRSIRLLRPVGILLAVSILAAACGSSAASTAGSSKVEKPDVTVTVVPATSVAGLYIAQQRGYFTAAGPHVTITPVASGVNALPNLIKGSVDVDEGQWTSDLAVEAAGAARLHVLAPGNSGGNALEEVVTPPGSAIRTVDQLRGTTIAVNALNGLAVLLTTNVLNSYGVPALAVHFVVIPFPAIGAALAAHRPVDRTSGVSSTASALVAAGFVPVVVIGAGENGRTGGSAPAGCGSAAGDEGGRGVFGE